MPSAKPPTGPPAAAVGPAAAAVPALPVQGRILKSVACPEDAAAGLEVLDFYWAPLNLYVIVTLPAGLDEAAGRVLVRVRPHREGTAPYVWNVPARPEGGDRVGARRLLVGMSCARGGFEVYEAQLIIGGRVAAAMRFERRFGADRLIGGVRLEPMPQAVAPLLITGTPKSGTTWLETIVDTRPDVLVLHEGNSLNTLEHRATRAQFEARLPEFRSRGFVTWRPAFPTAEEMTMFAQISVARTLFELLGTTFHLPIVVDRTPGASESYHFLVKFWRECRYVHVVRHPLDVFVSRLFHEAALGRGPNPGTSRLDAQTLAWLVARIDSLGARDVGPGDLIDDDRLAAGAFDVLFDQWLVDQRKLLEVMPGVQERFLLVKYEDLVRDLAGEAGRVLAFVGPAPAGGPRAEAVASRTTFSAMSGGRRAGEEDRRSFFRSGRVGDHRRYLSPSQRAALWGRVAGVAGSFGYTLD